MKKSICASETNYNLLALDTTYSLGYSLGFGSVSGEGGTGATTAAGGDSRLALEVGSGVSEMGQSSRGGKDCSVCRIEDPGPIAPFKRTAKPNPAPVQVAIAAVIISPLARVSLGNFKFCTRGMLADEPKIVETRFIVSEVLKSKEKVFSLARAIGKVARIAVLSFFGAALTLASPVLEGRVLPGRFTSWLRFQFTPVAIDVSGFLLLVGCRF